MAKKCILYNVRINVDLILCNSKYRSENNRRHIES